MDELSMITCIVQRGKSDKVVDAAIKAGAQGATITYGRGTGVRQQLGILAKLIVPEKEIIYIVTKNSQTEPVFQAVVRAAQLQRKGQGFAYVHKLDHAVGFIDE